MAERTPAQEVASWARKAREATIRRDEAIRQARTAGMTLRQIAEAAGMTAPGVARVLERA